MTANCAAAARAVGAFRVLAHPFHPYTPWTDWKTNDFDGMEIWNEDATWRQNNIFDLLVALIMYGVNNQLALVRLARTPEENFAKWDELLQQRPVAGICAADTHARIRLAYGKDWRFLKATYHSGSLRMNTKSRFRRTQGAAIPRLPAPRNLSTR